MLSPRRFASYIEYKMYNNSISISCKKFDEVFETQKGTSNVCIRVSSLINYIVTNDTLIRSKEALESDKWTMWTCAPSKVPPILVSFVTSTSSLMAASSLVI